MERAVGFRRGSFPAALIVPADGRAAAGPPVPMSRDRGHCARLPGLTRPVPGVPGRRVARRSSSPRRPGARYRESIWPRS